jgi:hypothetical protein
MGVTLSLFADLGQEEEKPKKKPKKAAKKSVAAPVAATAAHVRLTLADVQTESTSSSPAAAKIVRCRVVGCSAPARPSANDERGILCETHGNRVPAPMWFLEKLAQQSGKPEKIAAIIDRIVKTATGAVVVQSVKKSASVEPVRYSDGVKIVQNPYERLLPKTRQTILALPNEAKLIRKSSIKDPAVLALIDAVDRTGRTSMVAHVKVVDDEIDLVFRAQIAASLARNGAIVEAEQFLNVKATVVEQEADVEEFECHSVATEEIPLTDEQWEDLVVSQHRFRRASSRTLWLARGRELLRCSMTGHKRGVLDGMKRLLSAEPDTRGNMFDPETGEVLSGPDSLLPSAERMSVPR